MENRIMVRNCILMMWSEVVSMTVKKMNDLWDSLVNFEDCLWGIE